MFGKLKEKLKKTLDIFSKKTEEEAEEKPVETVVEPEETVEKVKEETEQVPAEEKEIVTNEPEKLVEETVSEKVNEEIKEEKPEVVETDDLNIFEEPESIETEEVKETEPEIKEPVEEEVEPVKEQEPESKELPTEEIIEQLKVKTEELEEKQVISEDKTEKTIEEPKEEIEEKPIPVPVPKPVEEKPKKKSFFGKLKETITTKTISADKFDFLFWDLELVLLENNVSVEVIEKIKADLQEELVDKPLPRDVPKKIEETLKNTLTEILTFDPINLQARIKKNESKPYVIAFFGINGSGKTTTIAKLSHKLQQNGLKTVLAASDTFRAAAIQQLEEHSKKLGTKIIKHDYGSDAAAVAFDAIKYAQKQKLDVVLIDTAGRLHSNVNLMDELKKIVKVTNPNLKVFIGESITGNDCIEQAKQFNETVKIDAAILTKADVDEKGGAPLSIAYTIKKPILYLGMGQEYDNLEEFKVDKIMGRLGF